MTWRDRTTFSSRRVSAGECLCFGALVLICVCLICPTVRQLEQQRDNFAPGDGDLGPGDEIEESEEEEEEEDDEQDDEQEAIDENDVIVDDHRHHEQQMHDGVGGGDIDEDDDDCEDDDDDIEVSDGGNDMGIDQKKMKFWGFQNRPFII